MLDNQKLSDLPNLGRNPFMLSKIVPNVIPVGNPAYNRMEDQSGSSQISIAGGPVRGNNYLIDGVPITDSDNRAIIIPSLEAVQEVKIQANTYDAEMARTGGGMFNTLMKSGTNDYHGSLYGHMRSTAWDANSYLQQRRGDCRSRTSPTPRGARASAARSAFPRCTTARTRHSSISPIEHYDDTQAASQRSPRRPPLKRRGIFEELTSTGALLVIYDPLNDVDGARQPFAGNIIPTSRLSPVGVGIADEFQPPLTAPSYYGSNDITARPISLPRRAVHRQGR